MTASPAVEIFLKFVFLPNATFETLLWIPMMEK